MQIINIIYNAVQSVKECRKICWVPLDQMLVNTKPLHMAGFQFFHFYWIFAWIPILVKSFPPLYWDRPHIWHCISLRYQAWRFGTCIYCEVMPGARLVCEVASGWPRRSQLEVFYWWTEQEENKHFLSRIEWCEFLFVLCVSFNEQGQNDLYFRICTFSTC